MKKKQFYFYINIFESLLSLELICSTWNIQNTPKSMKTFCAYFVIELGLFPLLKLMIQSPRSKPAIEAVHKYVAALFQ